MAEQPSLAAAILVAVFVTLVLVLALECFLRVRFSQNYGQGHANSGGLSYSAGQVQRMIESMKGRDKAARGGNNTKWQLQKERTPSDREDFGAAVVEPDRMRAPPRSADPEAGGVELADSKPLSRFDEDGRGQQSTTPQALPANGSRFTDHI